MAEALSGQNSPNLESRNPTKEQILPNTGPEEADTIGRNAQLAKLGEKVADKLLSPQDLPDKPRENWLTNEDCERFRQECRIGDVICVGDLRSPVAQVLGLGTEENTPYTHAMICTGPGEFTHATHRGVVKCDIDYILRNYDTYTIFHPPERSKPKETITAAVNNALSYLGTPYDYSFQLFAPDVTQKMQADRSKLYCVELVLQAYAAAGVKILDDLEKYKKNGGYKPIHPQKLYHYLLSSGFLSAVSSQNIKFNKGNKPELAT